MGSNLYSSRGYKWPRCRCSDNNPDYVLTENYMEVNQKLPVLVYIHGESYEWNSGNPYDGTVLASYGQVVVVTINFRLGILGFFRPALTEDYPVNLGLVDQIAALHWIQVNIAAFGGDPTSVTLFGHGTGAALANLLLISPTAQSSRALGRSDLFHRAILMSGSAFSKWAFTWEPDKYTIQVANELKCPLSGSDDLVKCLRRKTVEELLAVPVDPPSFTTPFGPILDKRVITQDPLRLTLAVDKATLAKYDLLYGVSSAACFNILKASEVKFGMSKERKDRLLKAYISNTFNHQTSAIYATVNNEYTTWNSTNRSTPGKSIEMEFRDRTIQIFNDAEIVAPLIRMGDLHSELNHRSYFYVFNHQSVYGDYPFNQGTVLGEELPYIFGAPLVGGFSHFGLNYTLEEQFLSEFVITLWTNFAKTGNPNLPTPQGYKTEGASYNWKENMRTLWPAYDKMSQQYLHIDMQVVKKSHYRAKKLAVWNRLIPELISSSTPPPSTWDIISTIYLTPRVKPQFTTQPPSKIPPYKPRTVPTVPPSEFHKRKGEKNFSNQDREIEPSPTTPTYAGTPMSVVILIGIVILFLNCFAMAGIYYKRDKMRSSQSRTNRRGSKSKNEDSTEDIEIAPANVDSSPSLNSKKEGKDKKQKPSKSSKSGSQNYNSEEILLDSASRILSSRDSTLKKKQPVEPPSSLSMREGKKAPTKDQKNPKVSKTVPYIHKRNKSDNYIYSEVNIQSSPEVIYRKNPFVKFRNGGSLSSKSMNKSSTSIASIKSTSSRNSVKSNSSVKPIKKNASCQSLPTPEYCWGITREMTMGRDDPEGTEEKPVLDRQHTVAAIQKKKYPKVLPDVPFVIETHAATLPKAKPPPPLRSTSLTAREMEELEDMHVIYRKGRNSRSDINVDSCEVTNMEPFYGTGAGEAPASPSGMYGAAEAPTATVRRSRKSDGFEYGQSGIYTQYPPYESFMQKEPPKIPSVPQVPEPAKNYTSFGDSRSPRGPLGTFGKTKETTKSDYDGIKCLPSKGKDSSANTSTTSSSSDTSPLPIHSGVTTPSYMGPSSRYITKPRNQQPYSENKTSKESESEMHIIYDQKDKTGTIKRKKSSASSKYQPVQEISDKQSEKPLKSVLKTTSAYDKPKTSTSASSLSSSASINLISVSSGKSIYGTHEQEVSNTNSLKKGARVVAPSTRIKSQQVNKESKK